MVDSQQSSKKEPSTKTVPNDVKSQSNSADNKASSKKESTFRTSESTAKPSKSRGALWIAFLALIVALGFGGYFYYQSLQEKSLDQAQQETMEQFAQKMDALQKEYETQFSALKQANNTALAKINQLEKELTEEQQDGTEEAIAALQKTSLDQKSTTATLTAQIEVLQQHVMQLTDSFKSMNASDNQWMIAQSNYLISLAFRKLWIDQDYATAYQLLKSADASLAQMNDPKTIPVRKAISDDLSQLSSYQYIDYDGIILTLMRLSESVDELPLIAGYNNLNINLHDDSFINNYSPTEQVTDSLADWPQNLNHSMEHFFSRFITITRIQEGNPWADCIAQAGENRDKIDECQIYKALVLPEQESFLRENLQLKLLIAAQAVPRHKEEIYQKALTSVLGWSKAYLDPNAPAVISFLTELNQLKKVDIALSDTDFQLSSLNAIDALLKQNNK